jgi:hypothetical protein
MPRLFSFWSIVDLSKVKLEVQFENPSFSLLWLNKIVLFLFCFDKLTEVAPISLWEGVKDETQAARVYQPIHPGNLPNQHTDNKQP